MTDHDLWIAAAAAIALAMAAIAARMHGRIEPEEDAE
jgi:hypothetical protein